MEALLTLSNPCNSSQSHWGKRGKISRNWSALQPKSRIKTENQTINITHLHAAGLVRAGWPSSLFQNANVVIESAKISAVAWSCVQVPLLEPGTLSLCQTLEKLETQIIYFEKSTFQFSFQLFHCSLHFKVCICVQLFNPMTFNFTKMLLLVGRRCFAVLKLRTFGAVKDF